MTAARLLIVLAACPSLVHAEIYKCAGSAGLTVYQNFPCEYTSLGAWPGAASASRTTSPAKTGAVPSAKRDDAGESKPAPAAPRVGMSSDEVRAIWGEPIDTSKEEFAKEDVETWTYANSRSIRFDGRRRVTAVHW